MSPVFEEDEVIGLPRSSFYLMSNQPHRRRSPDDLTIR
jgi:hypothetical protein